MAFTVQNLSELSNEKVQQAFMFAASLVQEQFPDIDTRRGVIGQLVLGLDAILGAAAKTNAERMLASSSVKLITENPALADDTLVDNVVSNYQLTRRTGATAQGAIIILMTKQVTTSIGRGALFTAGGMTYVVDKTYTARTSPTYVTSDTDRLLVSVSGGTYWAFTINATAAVVGTIGNLRKDTLLTASVPPSNYYTAYAASDFTGGVDAETNAELLLRQAAGMAAKTYSNRATFVNAIRNADPMFANILDISIIGMGDIEMMRDQHWIFPVSGGGRTDMYLLSQGAPASAGVTKTAVLIDKDTKLWRINLLRDDLPGYYQLIAVRLAGSLINCDILSDIRSEDLTADIYVPDIETGSAEAVFSRYQAATIDFTDNTTATTGLTNGVSTARYDVSASVMPLVAEVQHYVGRRDVRNPCGDHLVKGAILCKTTLSIELRRTASTITINETVIAAEAARYVNSLGFTGTLYASGVAAALLAILPAGVSVNTITMTGSIAAPDGNIYALAGTSTLTIPSHPASCVTGRTTVFSLDPHDVTTTVTSL